MLVTGSPGGGRATIASPDVNIHDHLQDDVIPYLLCCKAGQSSNCAEYYSKRPSDRGTHHGPAPFFKTRDKRNTMVGPGPAPTTAAPTTQPPNCGRCCCGGMTGPGGGGSSIFPIIAIIPVIAIFSLFFLFGDPHITTHDGYQYTFNGRGEYVLIDMSEDIFSLQGRMAQINNTLGDASRGTVYKALVGKQIFSDTVQFEIIGNSTVIVLVNGEQIDFDKLREQEFSNVTVSYLGNNSFSASFSLGVYLEVREENGFFSTLAISLPETFRLADTRGLMGSYNGNASDDLIPRGAMQPLSLNSTMEEIHKSFGLSCK